MSLCGANDLPKRYREILRQARLQQKRRAPFSVRLFARARQSIAGHNHDRDIARPRVAPHVSDELPPAEPWDRHLRHDDVRMHVPRMREGFRAVTDGRGLKAERSQSTGVQLTGVRMTVREENQRSGGRVAWATAFHNALPG